MKIVNVKSLDDLDIVLRVARAMHESIGDLAVVIKKAEQSLSDEQRKLYFSWIGIIGTELGYSKDEYHRLMKYMYLARIYILDPDNHPGFAEMARSIMAIKDTHPAEYECIKSQVINLISIRDATVANMREFLTAIKHHAINHNIVLPLPQMRGLVEKIERKTIPRLPGQHTMHAVRVLPCGDTPPKALGWDGPESKQLAWDTTLSKLPQA